MGRYAIVALVSWDERASSIGRGDEKCSINELLEYNLSLTVCMGDLEIACLFFCYFANIGREELTEETRQ